MDRMLRLVRSEILHFSRYSRGHVTQAGQQSPDSQNVKVDVDETFPLKTEILSNYFKCSHAEAVKIQTSNPDIWCGIKTDTLRYRLKFLNEMNIDCKTVLRSPKLIRTKSSLIMQYYHILQDYGLTRNTVDYLHMGHEIMMATPRKLKNISVDPVEHILCLLPKQVGSKIRRQLTPSIYMDTPLHVIHRSLVALLLTIRLDCTEKFVLQVLQSRQRICKRSITILDRILTVLLEELKIPINRIIQSQMKLVGTAPQYFLQLANSSEALVERIKSTPSLMYVKPENFYKLEEIYDQHNVKPEQRLNLKPYYMSPERAEHCLKEIQKHKEFDCIKCLPNYLSFVSRIYHVKDQMERMKSGGYVSLSLYNMTLTSEKAERRMAMSNDHCHGNETIHLLSNMLQKSKEEIRQKLKLHPKSSRISFYNAYLVVNELKLQGVTNEQIMNGLPIILYDSNIVGKQFSDLKTYPELSPFDEWKNHPRLVTLLIYYLEKDNFFSFQGVYKVTSAAAKNRYRV